MTALDQLLDRISILEILRDAGVDDLTQQGGEYKGSCPICGKSESGESGRNVAAGDSPG